MKLRIKSKFDVITKKSLFGKYINVSVLIVFLSFLVLGVILTIAISNYWANEKYLQLDTRAQNYAEFIRENAAVNEPISENASPSARINNIQNIKNLLSFIARDAGVDILVETTEGYVPVVVKGNTPSSQDQPDDNKNIYEKMALTTEIPDAVAENGSYFATGKLENHYTNDRYIAARPITYLSNPNSDTPIVMGIVIVTAPTEDISNFTDMVLKIFVLSAIAALAISLFAIGLFSYNLVRPLKQMAQAAKQFGRGDFSVRVSETSNDEIGELAVAFNNMAESLSSSETTRKSFVANVSHELKTPMTTIAGFIDGILDGTIPPEKHNYYLSIVSEEIKRLSRLVRSMLDLSRIDSGELKINYQNFDLFSMLVTIVITFEQEIEKRNIEIRGLDRITPKIVYGDKDLIHQVVYNLIENAVKFTNEGGYIAFTIIEDADRTTFTVTNSGTGIKKSEIPLVFERFYKTDKSRSKDKKGLGLGLYLVKSIIRLHGGEIEADSEYGEFTRFRFYLPRKKDSAKRAKTDPKGLKEAEK